MRFALLLIVTTWLGGCGANVPVEPLMPTPVLYTDVGVDPIGHIPESDRWTPRRVYFATTRARSGDAREIRYTNSPSDDLGLGLALIAFGTAETNWAALAKASTSAERDKPINLTIAGIIEVGRVPLTPAGIDLREDNDAAWLLRDLNRAIGASRDKDILVYVHGAKVNFYNACVFAAQLDHFLGRDMTSLAFSWPTRQNILAYAFGSDRQRAYDSAGALASLLESLADETEARRIHVLAWSAGARVLTRALVSLRERHPEETAEALRERLRIGTAYFAAGDVPGDEFLAALPTIHAITNSVIVTTSDHDEALKSAEALMGGQRRIGQKGHDLTPAQLELLDSMDRLEIVDLSLGREDRGFDITGHRYWFNHPWASTDVLLAIRTDLPPAQRGLVRAKGGLLWSMPPDYPERIRESLESVEGLRMVVEPVR
jgi:esterase/lipase superfamily enzyme